MASLFCWGFGKYGQLGTGDTSNKEIPTVASIGRGLVPKFVSCGAHYTLLGVETGVGGAAEGGAHTKLLSCGRGLHGRLGNGAETDRHKLQPLAGTDGRHGNDLDVANASAGHWHGCLVTRGGDLYSWGYNKSHGVLGVVPAPGDIIPIPTLVPTKISFSSLSCGFNFSVAVSREGRLYSWGCGRFGVLGQGDKVDRIKPTLIDVPGTFSKVHCGYCHTGFVDSEGRLYTCGKGEDGALGHGTDRNDKLVPTVVGSLSSDIVTDVSCSQGEKHSHTLICTSNGSVYSCGDGYKGKLGHGDYESCDVPKKIDPTHFDNSKVTSVACGGIHSVAMVTSEGVYTWGCGSDGRLGHPEAHGHRYLFHSNVPRKVMELERWKPLAISCSYYHTVVLCSK